MKFPIIGLVGYANSGKTSIAKSFSVGRIDTNIINFSQSLYDMMKVLGIKQEEIDDKIKREQPHHLLGGKTVISALISLGTCWGRDLIHKNIWVNVAVNKVKNNKINIFENVRFMNEAEAVKNLGGHLIYIERPNLEVNLDRASEIEVADIREICDYEIQNINTPEYSAAKLRKIIREIYGLQS